MNQPTQSSPTTLTTADLQHLKEKFDQLAGTTFAGILVHKKVKILNADPTLAAMFGYTPAELVDKTVLDVSTPPGREIVLKNILLEYSEPYTVIGLKKDGDTFPIEILSRAITYQGQTFSVTAVREVADRSADEITADLQQASTELAADAPTGSRTTQLRFSNELLRLELDERTQMEAELRDRARQQAAVAELGQRALVGANLPVLMDEAAMLVAQILRVEYVKILELLPGGQQLLLRAGFGWQQGLVGQATVSAAANSQGGYTLLSGSPVIIENLSKETRFIPSSLLQKHQVVSGIDVVIYGQRTPFGVLGAHTGRSRTFSEDDLHFLQAVANVLAAAIENTRLRAETEQRATQLAVLHELDRAITTSLRLTDIYHAFAQHALRLIAYDHMSIALVEGEAMRVAYINDTGLAQPVLPLGLLLPRQDSAFGWVVTQGQPLLRHNITTDANFAEDEQLIAGGIHSSIMTPLRVKGQVIGAWHIGKQQVDAYSPDDLHIAQSMADQLAIAVENARLFQQAQQEIAERQRAEAALQEERALLARRVAERTEDLQAANEELARAVRLKDEFLASMSHELRTPLTAVLGMTEVLKMGVYGPLSDKQQQSMLIIEESGRHLLELINDILDLSKIEANKLDLEIKPVAVETVCQGSLQFIKQAAIRKHIEVSFTPDQAVATLLVDERRFKQILVNLLSNAVKFTPAQGKVGLEVVGDPARQLVHFTVWDTGIGIAPEDIDRLFEPFTQLDSKLAREYGGTGLGLALVSRMTKMHGGQVSVESTVGQGSRFTVSLPWTTPAASVSAESVSAEANVPLEPVSTGSGEPALILLAEDEERTAKLISDYLRLNNYQVILAHTGLEALDQARQHLPTLILMDIQMPALDGLEAMRQLRAEAKFSTTPIIALTALVMPGDRERCLEAGASEYLSKPINLKHLKRIIDTHLARSKNQPGAGK